MSGTIPESESIKLKITIDEIPPSYNKYLGQNKRFVYGNDKKKWEKKVNDAVKDMIPDKPLTNFTVKLHYVVPNRIRRDLDNLAGKFLFDPLVKLGVIEDDNMFNLKKLTLDGEYIKNVKRTELTIEEIDE